MLVVMKDGDGNDKVMGIVAESGDGRSINGDGSCCDSGSSLLVMKSGEWRSWWWS